MPKTDMRLGWVRGLKDIRNIEFKPKAIPLPPNLDLFPKIPIPIFDQGNLGSCTGNGTSRAIAFDLAKQQLPVFTPSRLYLYYWARSREHTIKSDSGAVISDVFKAYNTHGVCDENEWPYDISKFAVKPDQEDCRQAKTHRPVKYYSVPARNKPNAIMTAIASGYPIVFGFSVYTNFFDIKSDGIMPEPKGGLEGGHCVLATGYDRQTQYVTCDNSWGTDWGKAGRFYMPFDFITSEQADDFWVLESVKG